MIKRRRRMDKAKRKLLYGDKKSKLGKSAENKNIEEPIEHQIKFEEPPILHNAPPLLEQLETDQSVENSVSRLKQTTVKKTKNGRRVDIKTIDKSNGGSRKTEKFKSKRRSVDESKNKEKIEQSMENINEDDIKEASISKPSKKSKQRYLNIYVYFNIFFLLYIYYRIINFIIFINFLV